VSGFVCLGVVKWLSLISLFLENSFAIRSVEVGVSHLLSGLPKSPILEVAGLNFELWKCVGIESRRYHDLPSCVLRVWHEEAYF